MGTPPAAAAPITTLLRVAARYLRAILGADAYERYCEHLARVHPQQQPPSERDFWREHQDWQDRNPQGRCC